MSFGELLKKYVFCFKNNYNTILKICIAGYLLLLDKAFDKVSYEKLFELLLARNVCIIYVYASKMSCQME